jgi:hypothetical protein
MKLKQPALPLKTIEDNLDLVFGHDIFLAFDNPSYIGGLIIIGTDNSNTCLVEYAQYNTSTILLEPEYVRDLATDAEPFYMNYAAVIAYNKGKNK